MAYLIFARREFQRPLEWIGKLEDDGAGEGQSEQAAESVQSQALERFADAEWIEMMAVPESALIRVIPLE